MKKIIYFKNYVFSVLFLVALTVGCHPIKAKDLTEDSPARAELISDVKSIQPGKAFWVALKITMIPGWHVYWDNPGESGLATEMKWDLPAGFIASPIKWLPPQRFEVDGITTFGYANEAYHLIEITPPSDLPEGPITLKGETTWLACKDSCIPGSSEVSLTIQVSKDPVEYNDHKALFEELLEEIPPLEKKQGGFKIEGDKVFLSLPEGLGMANEISSLYVIPFEKDIIKYSAPSWTKKKDYIWIQLERDSQEIAPEQFKAIIQIHDLNKKIIQNSLVEFDSKIKHVDDSSYPAEDNLLMIFLFAFLGGIILNAMPCVFPVLSLKAMTIVREVNHNRKRVFLSGLFYTIGVVISFLVMAGILILVKDGGNSVGWGFQMQNPYFVYLMILLIYTMGLSLAGEIHLPMIFGNMAIGDSYSKNEHLSNFWVGVLAVLVATPCTGPFMGVAMGYAFTQTTLVILAVFFFLSLGFAFPFLLLSIYTPIMKLLPKPGRWMETMKELMAFPMFLTVAWLVWVLTQQVGTSGLFVVMLSIVFIRFSIWLSKKYTFSSTFFRYVGRALLIVLVLLPITYLEKRADSSGVQRVDYTKAVLAQFRSERRPVFVYATAAWCITCKVNEVILKSSSISKLFAKNDIILMEADWTNQNPEITEFLTQYDRSGVPFYIYYPSNGDPVILPQILTAQGIEDSLQEKS